MIEDQIKALADGSVSNHLKGTGQVFNHTPNQIAGDSATVVYSEQTPIGRKSTVVMIENGQVKRVLLAK